MGSPSLRKPPLLGLLFLIGVAKQPLYRLISNRRTMLCHGPPCPFLPEAPVDT